jgi:23S rRNA (pseudouridine1915-N3)-methyltransferase
MEQKIPRDCQVVALDVGGRAWSTEDLSARLGEWLGGGRDVALLVGGPDGLADNCLARADSRWSLSALTLPHPLVRVLVAEQLYRAWTLTSGHPYHRA